MVAVFMVTYNHENYIEQAIESALMQKTTFPIKIFIGEDCSSDKTAAICLRYKEENPELIEVRLNKQNLGATNNAKQVFEACFISGAKYVAMLEGDDYWTDPYKLQKQVDFLEANEDFAICFHNVEVRYENGFKNSYLHCSKEQNIELTILDLAYENPIPSCSCIFRNNTKNLPSWFFEMPIGDWPLHIINAQYGKIKYFPEIMGVYLLHDNGCWTQYTLIQRSQILLSMYDILLNHFQHIPKFYSALQQGRKKYSDILDLQQPKNVWLKDKKRKKTFIWRIITNYLPYFIVKK